MKNKKQIVRSFLCLISISVMLCACAKDSGTDRSDSTGADNAAMQELLDENVETPDTTGATEITFSDEKATVSGDGAKADDGIVTITGGGTYVIKGETKEGRIIVNAPDEEVILVLENIDISCSYGSPVYIYKSSVTTLYLMEGTENTLTDGSEYTFNDSFSSSVDEEPNACLYSKSDLVIAGEGKLTVNANYNNGITGKDTLRLETACVTVTAKNHGINGKDSCVIKAAAVNVDCGGDALRSTNDTDSNLGNIVIADSSLELIAGEDGVQAENSLTISGGSCNIISGGGSSTSVMSDTSAKGLKGASSVSLYDGVYVLDCCDDAIHSNGNVLIKDGTYTITAGDDGIHADENVSITGGTIDIDKSYEGIEGTIVDISGGTINITASDDGINAAGGADQSGVGPRQDMFAVSEDCCINISGGIVTVDASGDGIDSNGGLTVSGGELYVSGPVNDGNGAFDYNGQATITGGIVVALGSSGMAQNFGNNSTQGSIMLTYASYTKDSISLKDESGNILVEYSPVKEYNCVVISSPDITVGNTYTVEACGETNTVAMDSLIYGNSGGMGGKPSGGKPSGDNQFGDKPFGDEKPGMGPDGGNGMRPDGENGMRPNMRPDGSEGYDKPQAPDDTNEL